MRAPVLPSRVWVGTYEFACEVREPGDKIFQGHARGICHFNQPDRGIYLCADTDLRERLEVLFHELKHAIVFAYEVRLTRITEEKLANVSGIAWSALFIDNPKLYRWVDSVAKQIRQKQKCA